MGVSEELRRLLGLLLLGECWGGVRPRQLIQPVQLLLHPLQPFKIMVDLVPVAHTDLTLVVFGGVQRQLLVNIHLSILHLDLFAVRFTLRFVRL